MRRQVLFEVTKEHLQSGLKGVPVGYSSTSYVDAEKGLFYVGRPIQDLALRKSEEIIYLLFFAEPGTNQQVNDFFCQLQSKNLLKDSFYSFLKTLPRHATFGQLFAHCLIFLSCERKNQAYREDALQIIAEIPAIILAVHNHQKQKDLKIESCQSEEYFQNFISSFYGQNISSEFKSFLNAYFIFHLDEGGGFLPSFVAKATSSAKQDVFQSLASGVLALEALINQSKQCQFVAFLEEFSQQYHKDESKNSLQAWLANKESFPGYGETTFKTIDSRVAFFFQMAEKSSVFDKNLKNASILKDFMQNNHQIFPNLDAIEPVFFQSLSPIQDLQALQALQYFAFSVGCVIQMMYDRVFANEGLGIAMFNPVYLYKHRV